MKPLVLTLFFLTAGAFAQDKPSLGERCLLILQLEAGVERRRITFTDNHPDIVALRREIEALRTDLQKDSPGYVCKLPKTN